MRNETPDAWIERNQDDPSDPYFTGGGVPDLCPVCNKVDCNCPPDLGDETPTPHSKLLREETGNVL